MSSKQLTCFSDFRYPLTAPDHPSLPNFVQYLESYVDEFKLRDRIHLCAQVVKLDKSTDASDEYSHKATVRNTNPAALNDVAPVHIAAKRVVITTGLHVTPNIPAIPGLNAAPLSDPPIAWIHSSSYQERSQLKDKRVLVLGAGETGMDVGYESVLAPAAKVWLGVRNGFLSFPKVSCRLNSCS